MNKIKQLIKEKCPNGVEHKSLFEITIWDKKFNGTSKKEQPNTITFKHVSAAKLKKLESNIGNVKLLSTGNFEGFTTIEKAGKYLNEGEVITIPTGGSANLKYYSGRFVDSGNLLAISADVEKFSLKYIYYNLINSNELIENNFRGSGVKHPFMPAILKMKIPIPPVEIQKEIIEVLDKFTELEAELEAELELRVKQYEFWREKLLKNSKYNLITLGDVGNIKMCKRIFRDQTTKEGDIPFYKISTFGSIADAFINKDLFTEYKNKYSYPKKGEILISTSGTIGKVVIFDGNDAYFQDSNIVWISHNETLVLNKYLYYFYQTTPWKIPTGGTIKRLYNSNLNKTPIYLPDVKYQKEIINILDKFDNLINNIKEGLPAEIQLRKKQYEYYRNKLLTFDELKTN